MTADLKYHETSSTSVLFGCSRTSIGPCQLPIALIKGANPPSDSHLSFVSPSGSTANLEFRKTAAAGGTTSENLALEVTVDGIEKPIALNVPVITQVFKQPHDSHDP